MTENKEQTVENEEIKVKIHRKPFCKIEMDIEASASISQRARKKAVKDAAKQITIPGFRKGKAPEDLVIKKHPEFFDEKWQKAIADEAFVKAQSLQYVPVLDNSTPITFVMKNYSMDGANLTFSFETTPKIPKIDIDHLALKEVPKKEIGTQEVEDYFKQVQLLYAEWIPVEDRAVQEGDFVLLDIETLEEHPSRKVYSDTRFEVTKKSMADWMRHLIIGQDTGAVLEGTSKADVDATEEEKKQISPKKVRITIKKIETPKTMELNDDFARGLNFSSMELMRSSAEKMLHAKVNESADNEERNQVNSFLINQHYDLPRSLIEVEKNHRKKQLLDNPAQKSQYESMSSEDQKKFDDQLLKEAEQAVRLFYSSRKIIEDNGIKVEYQEIEQEANRLLSQAGFQHTEKKIAKEVMALATSRILLKKAQDFILNKAKEKKA